MPQLFKCSRPIFLGFSVFIFFSSTPSDSDVSLMQRATQLTVMGSNYSTPLPGFAVPIKPTPSPDAALSSNIAPQLPSFSGAAVSPDFEEKRCCEETFEAVSGLACSIGVIETALSVARNCSCLRVTGDCVGNKQWFTVERKSHDLPVEQGGPIRFATLQISECLHVRFRVLCTLKVSCDCVPSEFLEVVLPIIHELGNGNFCVCRGIDSRTMADAQLSAVKLSRVCPFVSGIVRSDSCELWHTNSRSGVCGSCSTAVKSARRLRQSRDTYSNGSKTNFRYLHSDMYVHRCFLY